MPTIFHLSYLLPKISCLDSHESWKKNLLFSIQVGGGSRAGVAVANSCIQELFSTRKTALFHIHLGLEICVFAEMISTKTQDMGLATVNFIFIKDLMTF